jgi:hypothetical protein
MHVCVIIRQDTVWLYVDGVRDKEQRILNMPASNSDPFFVGQLPPGLMGADDSIASGFEGLVKEMRYYTYDVDPAHVESYVKSVRANKKHVMRKSISTCEPRLNSTVDLGALADAKSTQSPSSLVADVTRAERQAPAWTPAMDYQVIELFRELADREYKRKNIPTNHLNSLLGMTGSAPSVLADMTPTVMARFHLLSHTPAEIAFRFRCIQNINLKLSLVLPLVDFSQAAEKWSLANRLSSLSSVILLEVKMKAWSSVLRQTNTGGASYCTVNRPRAMKAAARGNDPDGRKSVFGQLYRQLHFLRPSTLRTDRRPWQVTYEGEGGQDAGGLFRDSITHICNDLQSPHLPLFVQCPNSLTKFGDNQEKWLPNPSAKSSLHLSMFAFVGKLMGISIRGGHVLNLDLPSIVWKPLVGLDITRQDLEKVDSLVIDILHKVESIEEQNVTPETFRDYITNAFVTNSSDGREIELKGISLFLHVFLQHF